jgi:hypothetical protein
VNARTAHGTAPSDLSSHANPSAQGQVANAAADASAVVRDPAGVHSTGNPASAGSGGASADAPGRETFGALDAEPAAAASAWLHAGAHRAEAGYQDPALGWVGVRADLNGGGIHASLVPGSAEAAQTLGGHMAGLNAYLAAEHSGVDTVTLAQPEAQGAQMSADGGVNQGAGQGSGQREPWQGAPSIQATAPAESRMATGSSDAEIGSLDGSARIAGGGGTRISVMA